MDVKVCSRCGIEKTVDQFYKHSGHKDGLYSDCWECLLKRRNPKRYEKLMLAQQGLRKCKHCGEIKKLDEFEKQNTVSEKHTNRCCKCRDEYSRYYYWNVYSLLNNKTPKRISERNLPIEVKRGRKNVNAKKYLDSNINAKISQRLRSRLCSVLKGNLKCGHILDLLGISIDLFKRYLESKFDQGMNWENYGKFGWHIDHIIPCAAFDLSNPEQQRRCFHYTNLQPLWAKDNLHKSSFFNGRRVYKKDIKK